MGRLDGGALLALIGGIVSLPYGILGIVAAIWAWRIYEKRVPLVSTGGVMFGRSG